MSDWPGLLSHPNQIVLSTASLASVGGEVMGVRGAFNSAAAWPAANRALYFPVVVEVPMLVQKMGLLNGAVAGEVDVGLYSFPGTGTSATRLVSIGKKAMEGASALQIFDVADTAISPGVYYLAANCSTITTATFLRASVTSSAILQAAACAQQAVGEVALPATAAFARIESGFVPLVMATGVATL